MTNASPEWLVGSTERPHRDRTGAVPQSHLGVTGRNLVLGAVAPSGDHPVLHRGRACRSPGRRTSSTSSIFPSLPLFAATLVPAPDTADLDSAYLQLAGAPKPASLSLAVDRVGDGQRRTRTAAAPVLVFVYGFLAPVAVYVASYRIWPPGNARSLSRVLVALGLLQLAVVAFVDLPRFVVTGHPDLITGTFGTNAYQLVFFLLVVAALLAGIFALEPGRAVGRFAPALIVAIFAVILLAQYRALLATSLATTVVVGLLLGRHARGFVAGVIAIVAFAGAFSYVASSYPGLKLDATAATLSRTPWSYASQRYQATRPVARLYADDPFVGGVGTGPGTFSSRAWQTFANAASTSQSNVQGGYAQRLTGGVYETDVSRKYVTPQRQNAVIVEGSAALSSPFSSYLGLAAEVGLLGLLLIVGIYLAAVLRCTGQAKRLIATGSTGDALPAIALATTIGFLTLLQMGFLENWLEVTRITFLVWVMLAVVAKELDSRSST